MVVEQSMVVVSLLPQQLNTSKSSGIGKLPGKVRFGDIKPIQKPKEPLWEEEATSDVPFCDAYEQPVQTF